MKEIPLRDIARLLAYTLGALAVVTVYLVISSMVMLSPVLHDNQSRLLVALGLLALVEIAVIAVLVKTTQRERRRAIRRPADFEVKVGIARSGSGNTELLLPGHALDASPTMMTVLVEPDQPVDYPSYLSLWAHLPEKRVSAKARIVTSEKILADDHPHHLLRLQLVEMDEDDRRRYLHYLTELEAA